MAVRERLPAPFGCGTRGDGHGQPAGQRVHRGVNDRESPLGVAVIGCSQRTPSYLVQPYLHRGVSSEVYPCSIEEGSPCI